jgi:ABC-type uncharacterized transport system ATPase subunit
MTNKLELRSLHKAFGDCVANESVSLFVKGGSIHAVVGENGAGKSTAMKMLYGQYAPDSGEILLDGALRNWNSPADAISAGIGMVHQHFMLAGPHTVLENILLGTHAYAFSPLGIAKARKKLQNIMSEYGLEAPLDQRIEDLPVGIQQRVEILKLLFRDSNLLILDEPTAVLTPAEVESFFAILRGMAKKGKTILLITHKLKEVMSLADRVSVFRAGRVVAEREVQDTSAKELAELMVGRPLLGKELSRPVVGKDKILEFEYARTKKQSASRLAELNFKLCSGEVLGIAGVEGNGQSELIQAILFPEERGEGSLRVFGREATSATTQELRELGVSVLPEDRQKEALILDWSLADNFFLGRHGRYQKSFFLDRIAAQKKAAGLLAEYDVRPQRLDLNACGFSGGNQQKFVVGREMSDAPKILIAAQPTRGVDVGAIEFIHGKIFEARAAGLGVLLVSSELDELLTLSDRIIVLYRGRAAAEFKREEFDEKRIGYVMAGGA